MIISLLYYSSVYASSKLEKCRQGKSVDKKQHKKNTLVCLHFYFSRFFLSTLLVLSYCKKSVDRNSFVNQFLMCVFLVVYTVYTFFGTLEEELKKIIKEEKVQVLFCSRKKIDLFKILRCRCNNALLFLILKTRTAFNREEILLCIFICLFSWFLIP